MIGVYAGLQSLLIIVLVKPAFLKPTIYLRVCFLQLPPALRAGVQHPDGCAQKPYPPCFWQSLSLLTDLDVHSAIQHLLSPPPCLEQRPLR